MTAPQLAMKDLRRVVIAAAVGNVIEWYDFYIFGSLATLLATKFFAAGGPASVVSAAAGDAVALGSAVGAVRSVGPHAALETRARRVPLKSRPRIRPPKGGLPSILSRH